MAINGHTTYARDTSTAGWVQRSIERERSRVDVARYRFGVLLMDMQREIAKPERDELRIAEIALDLVDAEVSLSCARDDLAEAEEAA